MASRRVTEADVLDEVPGTRGYSAVLERFAEVSEAIDFERLHAPILGLLPPAPAAVLDVGAGTGRDAAALAALGHDVVAVEPTRAFLANARALHPDPDIRWVEDSLPDLSTLVEHARGFAFVLCHAVWQHLEDEERRAAMARIASLLAPGGVFALGLRHGPPGAGAHYFPASVEDTLEEASAAGLATELCLRDQPSAIPGKTRVTWTRLAFRKP